jgi:hypothetical protein
VKANIKEGHFEKETVKRGSLITSNAHIAEGCGLTIDNVRTALADLEETGEITRVIKNHYQIVTIVNYESYQADIIKKAYQIPSNPDGNSQATPMANPNNQRIKEYKNGKNGKKEKNKEKTSPVSPDGDGDVPKALRLKPIDEGTVDDVPEEFRDFCPTYADYWGFMNR